MAEEFDFGMVKVMDEDGKEHSFELLDAIETEEGRFVALLPVYENPEESLEDADELIILKVESEDGEDILCPIEDDELFDEIGALFEERLEELYEIEETDAPADAE